MTTDLTSSPVAGHRRTVETRGGLDVRPGAGRRRGDRRAWLVVGALGALAVACLAAFVLVDLTGAVAYILPRRLTTVAAMVLVAYAVGVSTVLFQTVTGNRILTPSIMGFDALYVLVQTVMVWVFSAQSFLSAPAPLRFLLEAVVMVAFAVALYRWLFTGARQSLHLVLLIGIVFATLFRGVSALLQRLMDPSEFIVLQDLFFASFGMVDPQLLGIAAVLLALASVPVWRMRHELDVLALGRDTAVSLGVDHRGRTLQVLVVAAVMVAVSTALVGPVTFFGLLVANLAYQVGAFRHRLVLPAAVFLGIVMLSGGQLVLQHVFGFDTALSIIIEFAGGIVFLAMLLRGKVR
ncbi:enterobactin ABC transporter permease [Citricoccus sp. SGAir0253]|uniref:iron chelate uptake ABC transporter family permease subunit n=1 Tax=Citricoccus sp. SGAir0253 TaxID=2567881 RepID=UPI0010CD0CAB|nr:iron chelate uptake ABC transporter family permease subunit [Citricoccus sp. SGAir0253]QCU77604.1 enterobactin ABC transporter permease [Citricoccus sp. SGAir0253]